MKATEVVADVTLNSLETRFRRSSTFRIYWRTGTNSRSWTSKTVISDIYLVIRQLPRSLAGWFLDSYVSSGETFLTSNGVTQLMAHLGLCTQARNSVPPRSRLLARMKLMGASVFLMWILTGRPTFVVLFSVDV